jgi:photosystem II stability/assembly factor-like uncharacterized protein
MLTETNWVCAGDNGLFMKTTNAGQDWYFHNTAGIPSATLGIGGNKDIWSLDANTIIITGEGGYIGRSSDGGATFTSVAAGVMPAAERGQMIWFANASVGFVACGSPSGYSGHVLKTTDGGLTWAIAYTSARTILGVGGASINAVYATVADGTISKSIDGGATWVDNALAVTQYCYGTSFLNDTVGFVCGSSGGIFRTTNGGIKWDTLVSPQIEWTFYQVKIVSATEIYVAGDPAHLYKTTDLGNTWSDLPIYVTGPSVTYLWYTIDKKGNKLTLGGDFGILAESTDGGNTWTSNSFFLNDQIMFDMQQVPGTKKLIAVGRQFYANARQMLISSDGGTSWSYKDIPINADLSAISMVNNQVGYASGTKSVVIKTTDGGETWAPVTSPFGGSYNIATIKFVSPTTGWVFVNYAKPTQGNIAKTTDGGATWTYQTFSTTTTMPWVASADMLNENVGYFTLNPSNQPIYKTTDGGATWFSVPVPSTSQITGVDALDENNLFITVTYGTNQVYKSTDGGSTWTAVPIPVRADLRSISFKDMNTGYVCGGSTTNVYRTTNGGASWSAENVHLPTLAKVYVTAGDTAFILGTHSTVLRNTQFGSVPLSVQYDAGWNLVSAPLAKANMAVTNIFPGANSPAYFYNAGYQISDTVRLGIGYWLRFPSSVSLSMTGTAAEPFTVNLNAGWNLIGTRQTGIAVSSLSTTPAGIINSDIFGYNNGYQPVTSLTPGKGYWVRTSQGGILNFNGMTSAKNEEIKSMNSYGKIKVTDSKQHSTTLYVLSAGITNVYGDLPPVPPSGFDCRFADNTFITDMNKHTGIQISSEDFPVTIEAENIDFELSDNINGAIFHQHVAPGSPAVLSNSAMRNLNVSFTGTTPLTFQLNQNYPNPFNPVTTITYSLPVQSFVSLCVYDLLGNNVEMLVSERQDAGVHSMQWNASHYVSGTYFYELNAGGTRFIKKMTLLK